jgi:hypothetical protein
MNDAVVISVLVQYMDVVDVVKCRKVNRNYKRTIDCILRSMKSNVWFMLGFLGVNEAFINAFIDKIDCVGEFYKHTTLSEEFLIRNYETMKVYAYRTSRYKDTLFEYQKCTIKLLRLYAPKEYFVEEYGGMYSTIFSSNIFPESIYNEYIASDARFGDYCSIDDSRILKFAPNIETLRKMPIEELNSALLQYQLPDEILIERIKDIRWTIAALHQNLSVRVIQNIQNVLGGMDIISKIRNLPEDYIDNNITTLHWKHISAHHYITPEFMTRYEKHINFNSLSNNSSIPYSVAYSYRDSLDMQLVLKRNYYTPQQFHTLQKK